MKIQFKLLCSNQIWRTSGHTFVNPWLENHSLRVVYNGTPLQRSCLENPMGRGAWWAAVHGVAQSRTWLSDFPFTFHFHALEKEMAAHSSALAWKIPGTGVPGELPSMGSHRVGHDWSDSAAAAWQLLSSGQKIAPVSLLYWTLLYWKLFGMTQLSKEQPCRIIELEGGSRNSFFKFSDLVSITPPITGHF